MLSIPKDHIVLYHGTSSKYLKNILEKGIRPYTDTKIKSHWECVPARDRIYLTNTYALYYAICKAAEEEDNDAIVFKVSVNKKLLLPDEDFLAQVVYNRNDSTSDLIELTEMYRDNMMQIYNPKQLQELGEASLMYLGTAAIELIPKEQLIAYTRIPNNQLSKLVINGCDPSVTIMHHKFMGGSYSQVLEELSEHYETTIINEDIGNSNYSNKKD